jgi:hypothetical protein
MVEQIRVQYDPKSLHSRKYVIDKILELSDEHNWEVTVVPTGSKKRRSYEQLAYTWGCVLSVLSKETGISKEDLWEVLKQKFNPKVHFLPNGEPILIGETTKKLNTSEYEQFLEQIRIWALSELNIVIPLPNEGIIEKVNG